VIGTNSDKARKVMDELYQPYIRQGNPIYFMDQRSSEMTKYAANSYLAMRISFMNEMANLCERTGANVDWVRIGMGSDSRIGKRFLFPGIGYGGSCFPKDVKALAFTAQEMDYDFQIINTVMQVNDNQKKILGQKVRNYFGSDLSAYTFAIWGLAFKPETDDIRDAPAIDLINELLSCGAKLNVFDPEAMGNIRQIFGDKLQYVENQYDALENASALIVVTEWSEFRNPDFDRIYKALAHPCIFDGRNVYSLEKMQELGFYYESMGRNTVHSKVRETLAVSNPEVIRDRGGLD
jgi:UDPglucose 6-dehydrogenase